MSEFRKYKSIENSYREKFINDTLQFHPIYHTCTYIAQEKIHGANFQVRFTVTDEGITIECGKRSGIIEPNEKFYNYEGVVKSDKYVQLFERVCDLIRRRSTIKEVILFGEFAGPGVQSGVDYGDKKFIKFFDMVIDGNYLTPEGFYITMDTIDALEFTVPIVCHFNNLKEALSFDVEGKESVLNPKPGNVWEGVVIKPWDTIAVNGEGEQVLFFIKKKDSKFSDRQHNTKDTRGELPSELTDAQHAFSEYLNETRLQDLFSKCGMIQSESQIGEYIKYMMEDAKVDFFKDCMDIFNAVDDRNKGKIFSIAGKTVAPMLMKYVG